MTRIGRRLAVTLTGVLMATAAAGSLSPALADSPPADTARVPGAASLSFGEPQASAATIILPVRFTSSDGSPVQRAAVQLIVVTDFFGDQELPVQTTLTNQDGIATVTYSPVWNGEHHVVVRFEGNEVLEPSRAEAVLTVAGLPEAAPEEPAPLEPVQRWAAPGAVVVTLAVWLTLALILGRVGWGVWRAGRGSEVGTPEGSQTPGQRLRGSTLP